MPTQRDAQWIAFNLLATHLGHVKQMLRQQMLAYFCPELKVINGQYFGEMVHHARDPSNCGATLQLLINWLVSI